MTRLRDQSSALAIRGLPSPEAPSLALSRVQREGFEATSSEALEPWREYAFCLPLPERNGEIQGAAIVVDCAWDAACGTHRVTMMFSELTQESSELLESILLASHN